MNAFEINKIVGAVLGTLLLVMGVGFLAEAIYAPIEDRATGYTLSDGKNAEGDGHEVAEIEVIPLETLLLSASADNGARVARKCQSCHNFGEGESNKVGPVLYGIVGTVIGANAEFGYSDIYVEKNSAGETWTYQALSEFLKSPKTFAPGTKMSFAGLSKEQDLVDMLAYLQSLSANPVPYPTLEAEEVVAVETAMPVVEEAAPVVEEAAPVVEEAAPVVEEAAPLVEEAAPLVEEAAPLVEEAAPLVEEAAPAAQVTTTEEPTPVAEAAPVDTAEPSFAMLLANANASKGRRVANKCKACHGFKEGDGNKVGPPLYNIVGSAMANVEGFKYSDNLAAMGAAGEVWSFENLNEFVTKPRDFIDRTKMSFSGLRKVEDRVNLLAYLQSLSANPVAFPG